MQRQRSRLSRVLRPWQEVHVPRRRWPPDGVLGLGRSGDDEDGDDDDEDDDDDDDGQDARERADDMDDADEHGRRAARVTCSVSCHVL
ncbi:hypothetical protein E4U41_002392 [Claviceps citrina]|nr:hypothetical protein E4U41_002392 [Claviceps citrina]